MSALLGAAGIAALASALLGLATALGVALLYPRWRKRLARHEPAARARRTLAWIASPLLLGILLTALCFLPSVLAHAGIGADHCPEHEGEHPHLCLLHPPHARDLGVAALLPLAAAGALLVACARPELRSHRLVRSLEALEPDAGPGHTQVLDSDQPLSFTAGILRPRVYISRGLEQSISGPQLALLVEHEHEHRRRRDPLGQWLAGSLALLHAPRTRRLLLADFALACEQACDESAARQAGDRLLVAETLLVVERLLATRPPRLEGAVVSFGGSDLEARVTHLLEPGPLRPTPRLWVYPLAGAAAIAVAEPLHHLTETALGLLTR